jgi:hypothetical protein
LPKRLKGVDVAAQFAAARELGGDFHDFLMPESNTLIVALGDVSGKGVPAASAAFCWKLVRSPPAGATPRSVWTAVLGAISHEPSGSSRIPARSVTRCSTGIVVMSTLGRIRSGAQARATRPSPTVERPGVPLGSFPITATVTFGRSGDLFVFCTASSGQRQPSTSIRQRASPESSARHATSRRIRS